MLISLLRGIPGPLGPSRYPLCRDEPIYEHRRETSGWREGCPAFWLTLNIFAPANMTHNNEEHYITNGLHKTWQSSWSCQSPLSTNNKIKSETQRLRDINGLFYIVILCIIHWSSSNNQMEQLTLWSIPHQKRSTSGIHSFAASV